MKTYPNIKKQALRFCSQWAKQRQQAIQKKETHLKEALLGASKSSAGDKHNTERAMLQLEREQLGNQLAVLERDLEVIDRIDPETINDRIHLGSLVYAPNAIYFICVSAGVFNEDNSQVVAISSAAPIARAMIGMASGDSFTWQGKQYPILAVY
ncbi:MAG: 3-oxoacyl-ACP synthase [Gilvibacter sp.]